MKSELITKLGKSYLKILINSVYGSIPGSDNYWYQNYKKYVRVEHRKIKIKNIIND